MKSLNQTVFIVLLGTIAFQSCSKKSTPKPQQPQSPITLGSYAIIKDQGSDNGDTVYYTRTITPCEAAARYTFTATTVTLTSPCTTPATATWTYDATTSLMTVTDSHGSGKVKIENITSTGFIYNQIATLVANNRYTLQLSN